MGKKSKSKKNKQKKGIKSQYANSEGKINSDKNTNETELKNEQNPIDDMPQKKKNSKEFLHKKKEIRRKIKRIRKKNKKKKKELDYQYFEEIEDYFMNPEDLERMPHDNFTPYTIPTSIQENKEYIPMLISESDIILELLDARDIYHSKNRNIEDLINNNDKKVLIIVITKSDLVSEEYINKIKNDLEKENKNHIIITSSLMREKIQYLFDDLQAQIKLYKEKNDKIPVKIGIIGAPNVGKNSLIQSLELIVNTNCEEKYIYFDEEKNFCVNSVPGITFDEDENNNYLISKKYKEIKDIPEPMVLINNLMDVVDRNKLKEIYEFEKIPENLDEFIDLLKGKYEFEDRNESVLKILKDIITGKISYEVNK